MTTIKYHDHDWTTREGSNVETCRGCRAWRGTGEPIAAIDAPRPHLLTVTQELAEQVCTQKACTTGEQDHVD